MYGSEKVNNNEQYSSRLQAIVIMGMNSYDNIHNRTRWNDGNAIV